MTKVKSKSLVILMSVLALAGSSVVVGKWLYDRHVKEHKKAVRLHVHDSLNEVFSKASDWPKTIEFDQEKYYLNLSFDSKLENYISRLLKRYRSDYSAITVIDNKTGKVLAAVGYDKSLKRLDRSLAFSSTHPSASLFKIVTSAELLKNSEVDPETIFQYRGRGTTLYKYQLKDKNTRWTRKQTFKKAFAYSNNVIFGKAAIKNTSPREIFKMANEFGFNESLMEEIDLSRSQFQVPKNKYNLAELATGFNRITLISPVHAALIASIAANKGVLKYPSILNYVKNEEGEVIWRRENKVKRILSEETAFSLRELMTATVNRGTARGSFRRLSKHLKKNLFLGGKTGSITGGVPYGKRDWFVVYAQPKNPYYGEGISISVMNINIKKWYVKSTYLARRIIEYYFKEIRPLDDDNLTHVSNEKIGPTKS